MWVDRIFSSLLIFVLVLRESHSTCNVTKTLELTIHGDVDASRWRLESSDGSEIMSGSGIDVETSCLSCGVYSLRVQDNSSTITVKDSKSNFITSCTSAVSGSCLVEVGRQVRFFVHNSTVVNSTGMGQYHEGECIT